MFPNAQVTMVDADHFVHAEKPSQVVKLFSNFLNSTTVLTDTEKRDVSLSD